MKRIELFQAIIQQWSIWNSYIFRSKYSIIQILFFTSSVLIHCWWLLGKLYRDYYYCRGEINFLLQELHFFSFHFHQRVLFLLLSHRRETTQDRMIIQWLVWHLVPEFWMVEGSRFSLIKQRFMVVTSKQNTRDLPNPLFVTLILPIPSLHLCIGLP